MNIPRPRIEAQVGELREELAALRHRIEKIERVINWLIAHGDHAEAIQAAYSGRRLYPQRSSDEGDERDEVTEEQRAGE